MATTPTMHITDRDVSELLDQASDKGAASVNDMPLLTVEDKGQLEQVPKPAAQRLFDEIDDKRSTDAATQTTVAHLYADGRKGLEPLDNVTEDVDEARYIVVTQQIVVDLESEYVTDTVHGLVDQVLSFPRLKNLEAQRSLIDEDIAEQQEIWDEATSR
ncbi:MAG: hypothetical protein HLX51_00730 [Micrococcaceae bacterium]|nr:hypothetical protein [Micrococcaceae bacterium]